MKRMLISLLFFYAISNVKGQTSDWAKFVHSMPTPSEHRQLQGITNASSSTTRNLSRANQNVLSDNLSNAIISTTTPVHLTQNAFNKLQMLDSVSTLTLSRLNTIVADVRSTNQKRIGAAQWLLAHGRFEKLKPLMHDGQFVCTVLVPAIPYASATTHGTFRADPLDKTILLHALLDNLADVTSSTGKCKEQIAASLQFVIYSYIPGTHSQPEVSSEVLELVKSTTQKETDPKTRSILQKVILIAESKATIVK